MRPGQAHARLRLYPNIAGGFTRSGPLSREKVAAVGRYFGREPRYSQEEAEAQAKEAIDAAVKQGRPPGEDWKALGSRMGDIDRGLTSRPRSTSSRHPRRAGPRR